MPTCDVDHTNPTWTGDCFCNTVWLRKFADGSDLVEYSHRTVSKGQRPGVPTRWVMRWPGAAERAAIAIALGQEL